MGRQMQVADLDRILQETGVMHEIIGAVAAALRRRHGSRWLMAFCSPDGLGSEDQVEMSRALRNILGQLADQGQVPPWDQVAGAATQWLLRLVKSRAEQWHRLVEVTDKAAATLSRGLGWTSTEDLLGNPEHRAAAAAEVARQLAGHLGAERTVATEAEVFTLAEGLVRENLGAGVLEEFLHDHTLTEIMLTRGRLWVERDGRLEDTTRTLPEKRALWFAQRLGALIGARVDVSEPAMDGFLPDGSRVHVIIPPVSMDGVSITIRRHARRPALDDLLEWKALSEEAAQFLRAAVAGRANILISGGTSSGKTSLLGVLAGFIPPWERVVTIEDAPELRLPLTHVVRLRTRRPNIEGQGEFSIRMLVRESLRMRPDRIVVGEVRGAEALDMVEAMNTGHDGGLSTAHANGPLDMCKRLGQMMKRGDATLTDSGAYELMASAIHLIVHAERREVGGRVTRAVEEIVEVVDYQTDRPGALGFSLQRIFRRGGDQVLRRVGLISDRLTEHLLRNGVHLHSEERVGGGT